MAPKLQKGRVSSFCHLSPACAPEEYEDGENDSDEEEGADDEDDTEVKEENGVLVLTDGNFDTFMEGKDTVLIEFYAPWYLRSNILWGGGMRIRMQYFKDKVTS